MSNPFYMQTVPYIRPCNIAKINTLFQNQSGLKTIPFRAEHAYIARIGSNPHPS